MTVLEAKVRGAGKTLQLAAARIAGLSAPARFCYVAGDGAANLGDEAMAEAARSLLEPARTFSLAPRERETRLRKVGLGGRRYFRAAVLGGGTLINPMWHRQVSEAATLGLPLWTLGTGVGSCGFAQAPDVTLGPWLPLLERFEGLGVRGPRSQEALRSLGLSRARVVGDLALYLTRKEAPPSADPPAFALNAAVAPEEATPAYLQAMAEAAGSLVEAGWRPVPVALHHDDRAPLQRLLHRIGQPNRTVPVVSTAEDFFAAVGPCSLMLGVRLHSAVLACCTGVPPLLVAYRDKCWDFMESMGLGEWCVDAEDGAERLPELTARLRRQAGALRQPVLERALEWKKELESYARELSNSGGEHRD